MKNPVVSRTLGSSSSGSVAIEFALVAPLLLFMLGAIVETGAFLLTQYQIQGATQEVTRKQLQLGNAPANANAFKTAVCAEIATIKNCASSIYVDVQRAATFGALPARKITDVGPAAYGGGYADTYQPAQPGEAGSVIVTYDWKFAFPFLGNAKLLLSNWRVGLGFGNVPGQTSFRRLFGNTVYMTER